MNKSLYFWLAAIMLGLIPVFGMDIAEHQLDWEKNVREEMIEVVQNGSSFTRAQKAEILDNILSQNHTLNLLIYIKSFLIVILLVAGIYLIVTYAKASQRGMLKPIGAALLLMVTFVGVKMAYSMFLKPADEGVKFLSINENEKSLAPLINRNFKGKVVYVDFWGTTCGPCLLEFRDFTKPLKEHYRNNPKLEYLYVSQGNEYLWKKQVAEYHVTGNHIFVSGDQYRSLYRTAVKNNSAQIYMPLYLIVDAKGNVAEANAYRPITSDTLYRQLDKYFN